jgi:DNA-binding NtrC family response regulator
VIAATNADVNAEAEAGRFRQDLLFRLNTIEIHLPPLRTSRRRQPLAVHFLRGYAQRIVRISLDLEPAAREALLQEHPWPGNVRELTMPSSAAFCFPPARSFVVLISACDPNPSGWRCAARRHESGRSRTPSDPAHAGSPCRQRSMAAESRFEQSAMYRACKSTLNE